MADDWQIESHEPAATPAPEKGGEWDPVKTAPSAPSMLSRAIEPIKNIPGAIADEFRAGGQQIKESAAAHEADTGPLSSLTPHLGTLSGAAQQLFSPITGTAKALVGDPLRKNLPDNTFGKIVGQTGEDLASMFGPGAVGKSMSRVADALPEFDKSVQSLLNAGVKLTPGMIWQGAMKNAEEFMGKVPFASNLVKNGQREGLESFNQVVINKALEPVGERLPKNVAPGRESIAWAQEKIGDAYDKILPKLDFPITGEFLQDVAALRTKAATLREAEQKQLAAFGDDIAQKISSSGSMSGKTYKQVESELSYAGRGLMKSPDPEQRRLGGFISELRGIMMDNLERANPKYAGQLKDINSAYAAFIRAQDASIRRTKSGGIFSPDDLLQTIKNQTSKGAFARGDGLYQDLAESAAQVLPANVPEGLGLVGHGMMTGLLGGALHLEPGLAATAALGALPYTKPGLEAVRRFTGRTRGAPSTAPAVGPAGIGAAVSDQPTAPPPGYSIGQEKALEGARTRIPGRPTSAKVPVSDAAAAVTEDTSDPYTAVAQ